MCNDMESSPKYIKYKNQGANCAPIKVHMQHTYKCTCMEHIYSSIYKEYFL